jgi:hypothetical protein
MRAALLAGIVWLGATGFAFAGPILDPRPVIETVVGANLGCDPAGPFGGPGQCLNDEDPLNFQTFGPDTSYPPGVGSGLVGFSDTFTLVNGDSMVGSATADAEFGRLMVKASAEYILTTPETAFTFGGAHTIELLTIDAPGRTGDPGTLDVTYLLDGTISSSGAVSAVVIAGVLSGGDQPFHQDFVGLPEIHFVSLSKEVTVSVPFTFGDPFFLAMVMQAAAGTGELCPGFPSPSCPDSPITIVERTGAGSGSADFFSSMSLTHLIPMAAGVPVLDATFSSASGTRYSVDGVVTVVPEPSSLLLLGTGLAVAALRWRRKSR